MGFRIPPSAASRQVHATRSNLTASPLRFYKPSKADAFSVGPPPGGFTPPGLGDFHVKAGAGVVMVNTSVRNIGNGKKEFVTNVLFDADHLAQTPELQSGKLQVLTLNNGAAIDGPMYVVRDASRGWTRVVAQLRQKDLRALLGTAEGLKFKATLNFADGSTQPVNGSQDFTLAKEQLQEPRR